MERDCDFCKYWKVGKEDLPCDACEDGSEFEAQEVESK